MADKIKKTREKAEQGDAIEQFNLGFAYFSGKNVEQDYVKAVEWFLKSAEQGIVEAQYNLGLCYRESLGVEGDYEKALDWFQKAAAQGYKAAGDAVEQMGNSIYQNSVGMCYYRGSKGYKQDFVQAVAWFQKAADQKDWKSAGWFNLGMCYFNGKGVEQDQAKAVELFREAAVGGAGKEDAYAAYQLWQCYANGIGVEQDQAKADEFYKKAAEDYSLGLKKGLTYLDIVFGILGTIALGLIGLVVGLFIHKMILAIAGAAIGFPVGVGASRWMNKLTYTVDNHIPVK